MALHRDGIDGKYCRERRLVMESPKMALGEEEELGGGSEMMLDSVASIDYL